MKILITESKLERTVIKWLNGNYSDLESYEDNEHPDYLFYKQGNTLVFYYNKKNRKVYIEYDEIWSNLEGYFGMEDIQVMPIIKTWLEEKYNLSVKRVKIGWGIGEL